MRSLSALVFEVNVASVQFRQVTFKRTTYISCTLVSFHKILPMEMSLNLVSVTKNIHKIIGVLHQQFVCIFHKFNPGHISEVYRVNNL